MHTRFRYCLFQSVQVWVPGGFQPAEAQQLSAVVHQTLGEDFWEGSTLAPHNKSEKGRTEKLPSRPGQKLVLKLQPGWQMNM